MAEVIAAIGIVASVAQLAEYGFKLSVKLFNFGQAVSAADQSIKGMSNDVSLTSTVLQELCYILKSDGSRVVSDAAIRATEQTVRECLLVFEQLNEVLDKSLANLGMLEIGDGKKRLKRGTIALEKLKWPFKQPKMELLRSNLDRLKASLTLMLQVLSYARDLSNRNIAETSLAYQQHLIQSLAQSEREMKYRYFSLQMAIESQSPPPAFGSAANTLVQVRSLGGIDESPQQLEVTSPPTLKPRTLIGELLLCFQLLSDILGYHVAVTKHSEVLHLGYEELRIMLEKIRLSEMKRLEAEYDNAPIYVRAEAAQNLHTRLKELARAGYLKQRVHEDVSPSKKAGSSDEHTKPMPVKQKPETLPSEKVVQTTPAALDYMDYVKAVDPYAPFIPKNPKALQTPALQAQIDDTVGLMRENINKVAERGEKLNSLGGKTDDLAVTAQGFRRGANRIRKGKSPWVKAYGAIGAISQNVAELSIGSYKAIQGLSGSIYDAGTVLFSKPNDDDEILNEPAAMPGSAPGGNFEIYNGDEDEETTNEKVVEELLAEWTTLHLYRNITADTGDSED